MEETMPSSEALSGLSSPDDVVKLQTLSRIGSSLQDQAKNGVPFSLTAITEITRLIHDQVPEIRREAMWVLARADGSRANNELTTLASNLWTETGSVVDDSSPYIADLVTCIQALGYLNKQSQNDPILAQCSLHPNKLVRGAAYNALAYTYAVPEEGEEFGAPTAIRQFARRSILYLSHQPDDMKEQELLQKVNGNPATKSIITEIQKQAWNERTVDPAFVRHVLGLQDQEKEKLHYDISNTEYSVISDLALFFDPGELQEMIDASQIQLPCDLPRHFVFNVIQKFNERFHEALNPETTEIPVLCGPTENVDRSCYLHDKDTTQAIINAAIFDAIEEGKEKGIAEESTIETILEIKNNVLQCQEPKTKAEIVGLILRTFRIPQRDAVISDIHLRDWIGVLFQRFNATKDRLGGASANMVRFQTDIGEVNVVLYSEYHSKVQANAFRNSGGRTERVKFFSTNGKRIYADEYYNDDDPTKINLPVEIQKELEISLNQLQKGLTIISNNVDRIIFKSDYFYQSGEVATFDPIFPDAVFEAICNSDIQSVIIGGSNNLQKMKGERYDRVSKKLQEQLQELRRLGKPTHYELSGDPKNIQYLKDTMKDTLYSLGVNSDELPLLADSIRVEQGLAIKYPQDPHPQPGDLYDDALVVAEYLNLDRLYMHGHEFDLTLRKNTEFATGENEPSRIPETEMNKILHIEQQASFYAKQRILERLQDKKSTVITSKNDLPTKFLRLEGFTALFAVSWYIAKQHYPKTADRFLRKKMMSQIAQNGFAFENDRTYSVAIAPNKWIYKQENISNTTGSGAVTSSTNWLQALMSILREKRSRHG
jgi:ADP-dependent phosphofructokinase/glucokinase